MHISLDIFDSGPQGNLSLEQGLEESQSKHLLLQGSLSGWLPPNGSFTMEMILLPLVLACCTNISARLKKPIELNCLYAVPDFASLSFMSLWITAWCWQMGYGKPHLSSGGSSWVLLLMRKLKSQRGGGSESEEGALAVLMRPEGLCVGVCQK